MAKNIVLFVDDEVNILSSIRRAVIDEDYDALFACSGQEALEQLAKHEVSVMVTDMRMPGMDGLTLLKKVKENYPDIIKLVLSGYTQITQVLATVNEGDIHKFITKPWKMDEDLLMAVRKSLEYYNLKKERVALELALEQRNQAYQKVLKSMEEKMTAFRQDVDVIRRLDKMVFAQVLEGGNPAIERERLLALQKCMMGYLDIVPTSSNDITLKLLEQELGERFLPQYPNLSVSCQTPEISIMNLSQRAVFAVQLLLQQMLLLGNQHQLDCRLSRFEYQMTQMLKVECEIRIQGGTVQNYLLSNARFGGLIVMINILSDLFGASHFKVSSKEKDKITYGLEILAL
ncbi:response regulator [Azotosporobacter soli]|uniref:response regulator n=1 Tax=Azotosporobacter soli TaxID=3055040 RepID=UPI0031FEFA95